MSVASMDIDICLLVGSWDTHQPSGDAIDCVLVATFSCKKTNDSFRC